MRPHALRSTQVYHGAFHGHRDEEQRAADADRRGDGRDYQQRRSQCQERRDRVRVDHPLDQPQSKQSSSTHRQAAALYPARTAQHAVFRRNCQGISRFMQITKGPHNWQNETRVSDA